MGTIGGILDISKRSLNAQSQVIRTISDNIANVNTPGYSRRTAELVTTQSAGVGNLANGTGVEVNRIVRTLDQFLNQEYLERIADRAGAEMRQEYISRAEQPFSLEDTAGHISYELTRFFASLQDLAASPADIPLRSQVIQNGQSLTASIRDTFNHVAGLQREADQRIQDTVSQVNTLTEQIASLNGQIAQSELSNQENLTLRDNRDQLLRDLNELIPVQTLELDRGQVLVSLSSGFALVNGADSNALEFSTQLDGGGFPNALDGGPLGSIVFDYTPGTAGVGQVDMTTLLANQGGKLGGLLQVRGYYDPATSPGDSFDAIGVMPEIAARVEVIARDLLTRFNLVARGYTGPTSNVTPVQPAGGPYAGDDSPTTTPATFTSTAVDLNGARPAPYYMFSFLNVGDTNANGLEDDIGGVLAGAIQFGITDERDLAAALDQNATEGGLATFAPGDSTIIDRLIALRDDVVDYGQYGVGNFNAQATIEDAYRQTVGYVGGLGSKAKSDFDAYKDREDQVKDLRASISGVSLDEEFANLINYQRAFEGAARMIRVGDEMFSEIINLLG